MTTSLSRVIFVIVFGGVWLFFWITLCMYIAAATYKAQFVRSKSVGKLSAYLVSIPFVLMAGTIPAFWFELIFMVFPMTYSWEVSTALSAGTIIFFIWCMYRLGIEKLPLWLSWPFKSILIKFLDEVHGKDYHGLT